MICALGGAESTALLGHLLYLAGILEGETPPEWRLEVFLKELTMPALGGGHESW
jgi:hypothetical protein